MKKIFVILAAISVLSSIFSIPSYSQEEGKRPEPQIVKLVRVKDNKAVSTATILSKIKTKADSVFSQDVLNDDLKRLYMLGYFTDVSIDVQEYQDGLMVTFIVQEKPLIEVIDFVGNESMRAPKLKEKMVIKSGELLDENQLLLDIAEIKKLYESRGYFRVGIDYKIQEDKKLNTAKLTIIIEEEEKTKIKKIYIEGNESFSDQDIMRVISTRAAALFSGGYFKKDVFKEDLARIKSFYQNSGYLDVDVDSEYQRSKDKKLLYITIIINEGRIYLVGDITVKGNDVIKQEELTKELAMLTEEPFSDDGMRIDAVNMQQVYYNKGYIMARVFPTPILDENTGKIDIIYEVTENELIYVNTVDIRGNTKTKDVVIRRELRIYPGEPFNGSNIRRSRERLNNLGFFEEVSFDTEPTDKPNEKNLAVNVKETKTGEFSFGGGYSSIDQFIGFVSVTQRNFDLLNFPTFTGDGQHLTIKGELGMVRSNYVLSWTEPWIFDYPLSFGFDLYRKGHERSRGVGYSYEESRTGGDLRFGKEFTEQISSRLIYKLEEVDISDIPDEASADLRDEEGDNVLSTLGLYTAFDSRDNVFNPTRGILLSAGVEEAGGPFLGDKDFFKYTTNNSIYFSWLNKRLVLELSGRAGIVHDYGDSDTVPIYERFYAGGAGSIRGYRERSISPQDSLTDDPIGGEAMVIGNAEATFPVFKDVIKAAVFFDTGNVWAEADDFGFSDYKYGAGAGVRVKTPMGPLKLDWGYPIKEVDGQEQKGRFYFSMSRDF